MAPSGSTRNPTDGEPCRLSLIFALRGLWKCGESHPFFVGFEMIGLVALSLSWC